jgi:hypothetical protein
MGLSIEFTVRKTTLPTHLSTPLIIHYKISLFFWQESEIAYWFEDNRGETPLEKVSNGASGALNPVSTLKGIKTSSPLQAPIEAELRTGQAAGLSNRVKLF